MALIRIDLDSAAPLRQAASWDIGDDLLSVSGRIADLEVETSRLRENALALGGLSASTLLDFFDGCRARLGVAGRSQESSIPGVAYLYYFLARSSLRRLLESGLRGDIRHLDGFSRMESLGKKVMAMPRGLVTHWLAGNVPALGLISLVQGLLTKNANIIKLPRRNGLALPAVFREIRGFDLKTGWGSGLSGKTVVDAVMFVYCEPGDSDAHAALSRESDVRVAWGGREAVESITRLPRKLGSEDVIFGPRYSLAVVGREALSTAGRDKLAEKLALDASVFDQRGCSSPHAAFVERGGGMSPLEFARALASAMAKTLKRVPKAAAEPGDAYAVASVRAAYTLTGEVFSSAGTEWTVVYSEERGPVQACGSRVVFVRPVDHVRDAAEFLTPEVQTVGLALGEPRRTEFALMAAARGVSRIMPIGSMSLYDYPWDGLFLMDRLVRWVSLE